MSSLRISCFAFTCAVGVLVMPAASANDIETKLNAALLGAGEKADVTKAKAIADDYRKRGGVGVPANVLDTVDICYAAGAPSVTVDEREAILRDGHITEFYSPNDNMAFAEGFANGWGVKKGNRRAIAFACRANTVPEQLVAQVQALKADNFNPYTPFLFCHNAFSSADIGHCVAYTENSKEQYRRRELYNLSDEYNTPQRVAFGKLFHASWVYSGLHAKYEMGESTLPREQVYAQAVGEKQTNFQYKVKAIEARIFPPDRKGGYKPEQADAELNSLYRRIVSGPWADQSDHPGAVSLEGLRRTERAWVDYKNAWKAFALTRFAYSASDVEAYLTEERIRDLKSAYGVK